MKQLGGSRSHFFPYNFKRALALDRLLTFLHIYNLPLLRCSLDYNLESDLCSWRQLLLWIFESRVFVLLRPILRLSVLGLFDALVSMWSSPKVHVLGSTMWRQRQIE